VNDAVILLRDVAGDAASNAAQKINPNEDQLNQLDRPAEDNTWHEVPSVSNIKSQARETVNNNKPFSRGDVKDAANQGANVGQNQATGSTNTDAAQSGAQSGGQHAAQTLRQKAEANIPDENKDRAREAKDATRQKTKNYFNQKMPEERREQVIWRLKKMIVEIQGHEDCRHSFVFDPSVRC
jgi:hypothetical protein